MDSGALEFETSTTVRAYITRDGTRGEGSDDDPYRDRGGDIEVWLSTDGGMTWGPDAALAGDASGKIATSDLNQGIIFNDPQVVHADSPEPEARVAFCEWDNDAGNMVHRVFLWGEDGYRTKEFFPDVERIGGASRYEVSAGLADESFPLASDAIFIASGGVFTDALAGVPLAYSYNAPILLVGHDYLPPAVEAQIERLYKWHWFYGYDVVILGGPATISPELEQRIRALAPKARVRRIAGANRYEVSANIAAELESREGTPTGMVYASGLDEKAGDALSVSPLAAVKGWPILLTPPDTLPSSVKSYVDRTQDTSIAIVGGEQSISPDIYVGQHPWFRLAGYDRYATSEKIARFALDGTSDHAAVLRMSRYALASGEVFSDALPGGVLAARSRGPLFLTQHDRLPDPTRRVLEDKAYRVTTAYVLGGEVSVEPTVVADMVTILQDRQDANGP
jgi:putative cell wall-binding protein